MATKTSPDSIETVHDGVFFTLPEALPRGRHNLSREEVQAAQRERFLAAMTELLAARGYSGFAISDIASRAGISLAAFYDCFEGKEDCVFCGYDRFIEVLLKRLGDVQPSELEPAEMVKQFIAAYLETLQSDLVVARAFQVEIDALGPPARERRRDSLRLFGQFLRNAAVEHPKATARLKDIELLTYVGAVYATRQLASDALDEQASPDLVALGEALNATMVDTFRP